LNDKMSDDEWIAKRNAEVAKRRLSVGIKSGIYAIINLVTGKIYVGQLLNLVNDGLIMK